ncbi:MAG: glycosyltransferase family 117 protein [Mucilaginibacter sp.]
MQYNKINNLFGWLCFIIASSTYILTLEPSVSFWDCGEFISCAYRLQVAHQPGYPLFAMLGKAFSLLSFGDVKKVPYYTNMGSALASGATIMFLFWTITALAKKLLVKKGEEIDTYKQILIMGGGLVGALTFTFTDTFWFSAVETIVFALSSLCTAIVFWAILKWDAHSEEPGADKWIVFIAYIIGLSIGIHLLNLLTIPAIVLVYYFRRYKNINVKSAFVAFLISILILGLVQYGIRGYTVMFAAYFDLFFVNNLGMGFGTGAFVFFIILISLIVFGIWWSIKNNKPALNLALLCVAFIYFGYSSFAYIPIRATANTNLDNSHPDNAFTLYGYLNRIQYGETPLLFGPYFDAKITDQTDGANIYRKGKTNYEVAAKKIVSTYDHTTIFPRMYNTENSDGSYAQDAQFYRQWLHMGDSDAPTFVDNMKWMFSWQMGQMYGRYFLWNYVGRYNQLDGQQSTEGIDGNWTSGILDGTKNLPKSLIHRDAKTPIFASNSYTPLYALPLILGLIGLFFHFQSNKRDALIVLLLWFFTGLAIVFYVNQPSVQPRERDYSYVGSFYAFAIWIGLGAIALAEFAKQWINPKTAAFAVTVICLLLPALVASKEWGTHDRSTKMTPHDMAYNYLISCPKDAILFTYGDNDTYSLWYDQEVEGIRPDIRIVNLSLFSGDWYIRQMQHKMNESEPLPITMSYDKYKEGVRDAIQYVDRGITGSTEVKEVFDFLTSDNDVVKMPLQDGSKVNYLPTKNFKITVNPDEVVKSGVVSADQKSRLTDTMKWKYTSNYVTKDNLAFLDILAHNNWKRPICFTITVGQENMLGLQQYLYKEGFTYHLIPFKADTANRDQLGKTNTLVMYDNIMKKFKWGNFKTAKYLDPESTTMFYPVILSTMMDLSQNLIQEGHRDLALNILHKYDQEMPDIYPFVDVARSKYYLVATAYTLKDYEFGNKFANSIDAYLVDQLDYNYGLLQKDVSSVDGRTVQIGLSILNAISEVAKENKQPGIADKMQKQLKDYESKFTPILGKQQQ